MNAVEPAERLIVVIPVFDDWEALDLLLQDLDRVLCEHHLNADAVILDDGSTVSLPSGLLTRPHRAIRRLEVVHFRRNLGHQRAIAVGLAFVHATTPCDAIILMDGDGEDRPSDVPALLKRFRQHAGRRIIFAERTKRSESLLFRSLYASYRVLHRMLTGISVRVGNFSVIPFGSLTMLVVVSELWNHYAAAVFKARIPYDAVPTVRGRRAAGAPTMNFVALVVHGLSALSVFGDIIGVRLLVTALSLMLVGTAGLVAMVVLRLGTSFAIPDWASYMSGFLFLVLFQIASVSLLLVFIVLSARATVTFIPIRDYQYFIKNVVRTPPE
jgi:glycosyltransferase involved in cell wall biosynthesis